MTRVLVTGGCGFLGAWVVRDLAARGLQLRVADMSPVPDNLEFVEPGLSRRVELVAADVTRREDVAAVAAGCDAAVHLAGIMTVDCRRDPVRAAHVNLLGSLHVFEAALGEGMARVVYVSTAGVYGSDDGIHPRPMTHYGALKLAVEGCARAYFVDHGLPSVGFRPYIVYGPGESSGIAAGPSIACRAALEAREAEIRFTGRVGFVHVSDVARAIATAAIEKSEGAEAYNLCGETATVDDFVAELERQVPGARISTKGEPLLIAPDLRGPSAPYWLAELPVTGLAEGIARTLGHYRSLEASRVQGNGSGAPGPGAPADGGAGIKGRHPALAPYPAREDF